MKADVMQGWLWARDDVRWQSPEEVLRLHARLHKEAGEDPEEALFEVEQKIVRQMGYFNLICRYDDALSKGALTYQESPEPAEMEEVIWYLQSITLESKGVSLVQDADGGPIYVDIQSPMLQKSSKSIVKAMNRLMPPGVTLKALSKGRAGGEFAKTMPAYTLALERRFGSEEVTTWEVLLARFRIKASSASAVFKVDQDPVVKSTVVKSTINKQDHTVSSIVLEPDKVDLTNTEPDGSALETEGDIYNKVEIANASKFFMENGGGLALIHQVHGGGILTEDDVYLIENAIQKGDGMLGDQAIGDGTWYQTWGIKGEKPWQAIENGDVTAFSVGMNMEYTVEEIEVPA